MNVCMTQLHQVPNIPNNKLLILQLVINYSTYPYSYPYFKYESLVIQDSTSCETAAILKVQTPLNYQLFII